MLHLNAIRMNASKKILCQSMFELLEEQPLDAIRTRSIYERVNISQNAFYYHFKDKYDCASFVFRLIIYEALDNPCFSPEHLYEDVSNPSQIRDELFQIGMDSSTPENTRYADWIEKWADKWYSMGQYVRENARVAFLHIYLCRAVNSPYFELRQAWEAYFSEIHQQVKFNNPKQYEFLREILFAFFDQFLISFSLNDAYDFQLSDARNLMLIRKEIYKTAVHSFSL